MSKNLIPNVSEMTMLDYFACQALSGLILTTNRKNLDEEDCELIASSAYSLAVTMFQHKYDIEDDFDNASEQLNA